MFIFLSAIHVCFIPGLYRCIVVTKVVTFGYCKYLLIERRCVIWNSIIVEKNRL